MIILYSTGCPQCKMVEDKLTEKNIPFKIISDKDYLIKELNLTKVPVLEVNGVRYSNLIEINKIIKNGGDV